MTPMPRAKSRQVLEIVSTGDGDPGLVARMEATIAFHEMWCVQDDPAEAFERAHRLSASAWEHAVASGSPVVQVAALDTQGLLLYVSPDAEAMVSVGRRIRDLGCRMSVYELLGLVRQGRRAEFERVLDLAGEDSGFPWPEIWTHRALVLQFRSLRAFLDGDIDEALTIAQDMVDRFHERDPNFGQVFSAALLWAAYQKVGPGPACALTLSAADDQPELTGYRAATAFFLARNGQEDEARAVLDDLLGAGLGAIRQDASWSVLLALLAEAIALTGATDHARSVHDALLPYSGQALVMATGVFCYGAADRFLAMLTPLVAGTGAVPAAARYDAAVDLEAAPGGAGAHGPQPAVVRPHHGRRRPRLGRRAAGRRRRRMPAPAVRAPGVDRPRAGAPRPQAPQSQPTRLSARPRANSISSCTSGSCKVR